MFEINEIINERVFEKDGVPVLSLTLRYPAFSSGIKNAAFRVNAFYKHLIKIIEKYTGAYLLPNAVNDFEEKLFSNRPFNAHHVIMNYETGEHNGIFTITRELKINGNSGYYIDNWDNNGWVS